MIREIKTLFVAVWDADVIVSKSQVIDAVELLRNKTGDFVYPYNDFFLDTSEIIKKLYLKKKDIRILFKNRKKMKEMYRKPVGGVFFCNLDVYIDSGLENEQFYGWGVEDGDRYLRWTNSGYKIERTEEPLFHLSHPRGINSFIHNPDQSIIKLKELNAARCTTSKKKFS
jgi:predicted glycosyltransferase involved in capsule biosynthesis